MTRAQTLAQYGDFSGYSDLYGADAARQMSATWEIQNPLLAYNLGRIDAARYQQITGAYPPGYSTGSSGGGGRSYGGYTRIVTPPDETEDKTIDEMRVNPTVLNGMALTWAERKNALQAEKEYNAAREAALERATLSSGTPTTHAAGTSPSVAANTKPSAAQTYLKAYTNMLRSNLRG